MVSVALRNVTKVFPDGTRALDRMTLEIADGEIVTMLGPSGSGKTTALKVAAGLERPTGGEVFLDGEAVTDLSPQARNLAVVLAEDGLYPTMTVEGNLRFPLQMRHVEQTEADRRVGREARRMGLTRLLRRRPPELSAGQSQSVATGRALVRDAQALLLDEPLSRLDEHNRELMRRELAQLQREARITTLLVTHDSVEAMALGDRMAVIDEGRIVQVGEPGDVYAHPVDSFVAQFVGHPPMNVAPAALDRDDGGLSLQLGSQRLRLPQVERAPEVRARVGGAIDVGIRPHHVRLARSGDPFEACLSARIVAVEDEGARRYAVFEVFGTPWRCALGRDHRVGVGNTAEFWVDSSRVTLFDAVSGLAIWRGDDG